MTLLMTDGVTISQEIEPRPSCNPLSEKAKRPFPTVSGADSIYPLPLPPLVGQLLDGCPGGVLLGLFLAAALSGAHGLAVEVHLHPEHLGVVGPGGAQQAVFQHLPALPLHQLLEGGLVVPAHRHHVPPVQDEALDELPGRADAPVQIDGRDDGLHRVGLDGGPLPAAAGVLAPAQLQAAPQPQLTGHQHQAALAHQGRPGAGQVPLGQVGLGAEQKVRRHHAQHRVAQKFQPLVALQPLAPVLVGVGAVGQRPLQQRPVREGVTQFFLQLVHTLPLL